MYKFTEFVYFLEQKNCLFFDILSIGMIALESVFDASFGTINFELLVY